MVASMVSEIILCVKERNKQTRATAFELLVQIAHAMHEAEPPPPGLDLWSYEEAMEGACLPACLPACVKTGY
jgi:ribosomal RNA-processing protein 12